MQAVNTPAEGLVNAYGFLATRRNQREASAAVHECWRDPYNEHVVLPALGYLSWASGPWGWAAVAAVGVPVAVHLLSQPRHRPVVFPAARLLGDAAARTARMRRLRQWLLMGWRMMILLLIVAAFARPSWHAGPLHAASGQAGIAAVLLLDASASMTRAVQGVSLFEQAQRQVTAALRSLDADRDRAMVVLVDRYPRALPPGMTDDLASLIEQVQQVRVTHQRGDAAGALQLAYQQTLGMPDAAVHVFSDLQASNWQQALNAHAADGRPVSLHLHTVGHAEPNVALGPGEVVGPQPVAGQVGVIHLPVSSFAAQPIRTAVTMSWQGAQQRQTVELSPGGRATLTWMMPIDQPGWQDVRFDLGEPRLGFGLDRSVGLSFHAAAQRAVVVVGQAGASDASLSLGSYIQHALQAGQSGPAAWAMSAAKVMHVSPEQVAVPHWPHRGRSAIWVLAQTGRLDAPVLAAVAGQLHAGGSVLWLADQAAAWNLQELAPMLTDSLLPLAGMDWQRGRFPLDPAVVDLSDEAVERGLSGLGGAMGQVLARQVLPGRLVAGAVDERLVWMRFADQRPALLGQHPGAGGAGRLMIWMGDIAPPSSDFVHQPAFVVWLHELIEMLVPGSGPRAAVHPGDQPIVRLPGEVALADVVATHAKTNEPIAIAAGWQSPAGLHVQLEPTLQVGRYDIHQASTGRRLAAMDVTVDPRESDLAVVDPALLEQAAGRADRAPTPAVHHPAEPMLRTRRVALWPWLVAGALVLVVGEPLAARWLPGRPSA